MKSIDNTNILTRGETGIIAGVCSGIANYYGLRVNGLRIAFFVTSFFFAIPVLAYIVLWLVLPKYPISQAVARQLRRKTQQRQGLGS